MSGLLATLPPDAPTYAEHVIALAVIWGAAAIIVVAGVLATLVKVAADRMRRSRGRAGRALGRGRVERVAP